MLIIYPITFETPFYEVSFLYGSLLQSICLFVCIIYYVSLPTARAKSCLILLGTYGLFSQIADIIFNEVTTIYYILESLTFFSWAIWLMLRPELSTAKTINHSNILLAFYKGKKGSFIMNFFELFGLPVKSMCIIAEDKALYLKAKEPMFQFGTSEIITRHKDDYVIIDTGVRVTTDFLIEMKKHNNIVATRGLMRVRCIEAISGLLSMIGDKYKPDAYIPSLYLRQIIS